MDLAGIAAVLGAAVALFTAVAAPLQSRTLESRLRRTEKLLTESAASGLQQQMLVSARDHLVERIAIRELRPRYREAQVIVALALLMGVFLLFTMSVDGLADVKNKTPYLITGWTSYGVGLVLFAVTYLVRHAWLVNHREDAYRRDDNPHS